MICKVCGENKGEDAFYLKGHFVRGKFYESFDKTCKVCHKQLRINKIEAKKIEELLKPKEEDSIEELIKPSKEKDNSNYGWVLRNLRKFGNCYIKHLSKIDIPEMEETLNNEILIRKTSKDNQGYILEIKKEKKQYDERY